jgi:branched-chain amino acid transport system substrate-binding protein
VPNASSSGAQEADCLHRQGARRLVTVADLSNRAYTESWAAGARRRFAELGGELAEPLQFEAVKGLNYDDLTSRILKSSGDAVMLIASAADSALLVQQLRRRSDKRFLAVAAWAGTEQFLQMGGGAVEGVVVPQYFDRESKAPTYQRFADNYRARFAEAPGFPAMNAYDAMMFGALALQQQKPGMALLAATRQLRSLAGLQRPVLIDEFGDGAAPLYLTRVVDKRFVPVDPS